MSFQPRPYQAAAAEAVRETWADKPDQGALLVMATGTGKTETGLHICVRECLEQGGRVVWLAHRQELLDQPYQRLVRWWPKHGFRSGVVQANRDAADARTVFASFQTLANEKRLAQLLRFGRPDLLVVDEAHHSVSPTFLEVIRQLRGPHTRVLGLTATPDRDDDRPLAELWRIVFSYDVVDAIRDGWLVPPWASVVALPALDLAQVSGRRDYDDAELGEALLKAHVVEHTVAALQAVTHQAERLPDRDQAAPLETRGRSWLVFTATVEQARLTAEALTEAGMAARYVHADTPDAERRMVARLFGTKVQIICNAGIFTEGTDLPRCCGILLARPTKSKTLFIQMVGRGLRLHDPAWDPSWGPMNARDPRYRGDADCLIIDLAGATLEHDLVGAPLLLADGCQHDWKPAPEGKGYCTRCDATLSCWAAHEATGGRSGTHTWVDRDGEVVCAYCERGQCPDAPGARHLFQPEPPAGRKCMYCGLSVANPLSSLVGQRRREPTDDTAFVRLEGLEPEAWAVDVEPHGLLLLVGSRTDERWSTVWVSPNGGSRELTPAPVEGWHAWAIGKDLVVRRSRRRFDARRGGEVFGGHPSDDEREAVRRRAAELAVQLGVARWS